MKIPSYEEVCANNTNEILSVLAELKREKELPKRIEENRKRIECEIAHLSSVKKTEVRIIIELFQIKGFQCEYDSDCFIVSQNGLMSPYRFSYSDVSHAKIELERIMSHISGQSVTAARRAVDAQEGIRLPLFPTNNADEGGEESRKLVLRYGIPYKIRAFIVGRQRLLNKEYYINERADRPKWMKQQRLKAKTDTATLLNLSVWVASSNLVVCVNV